ncbi:MAG: hypothetical protein ABI488_21750 [Polyangiaceae bacterium]
MKLSPFTPRKHWLLRALSVLALAAGSCTVPKFEFNTDASVSAPSHCTDQISNEGETGLDCGGTCPACPAGGSCQVNNDCAGNECIGNVCQDASCTDGVQSGSETAVDCGGGACSPCASGENCLAARDCVSGVCLTGACAQPSCADMILNGDESDMDCGGACSACLPGQRCKLPTDCAGGACTQGTCSLTCLDGKGNCDGDAANGCETNLKTDTDHCNACDTPCALMHATARCTGGACQVDACIAPFADCDGDPKNGCETNTSTDAGNCSLCGKLCTAVNGTASCVDSACQVTCDATHTDCDGQVSNGCETSTDSDTENCGKCGNVCPSSGGTPNCKAGKCGITNCAAGLGDCDADGVVCETNTTNDVNNCGKCGKPCVVSHGTATCVNSVCAVASCNAGYANCTGGYADGCETNLISDVSNCGTCGKACAIGNAMPKCENKVCKVNTCTAPFADCDANGTDCETNTSTSTTNCGGCGARGVNCSTDFANATGKCTASSCVLASCNANHQNCDGNPNTGCETTTSTDKNNCGACGTQCKTQNASGSTCGGGACMPACNNGFAACSNPAAGCLTSIDSAAHCGNCTTSCTGGTPFCVSRSCAAHLSIGVVNSSTNATQGNAGTDLSVTHALQTSAAANAYRMVIVGIAGFGNSTFGLPSGVMYNGVQMTLAQSIPATNQVTAAIYYILGAALPPTAGMYTVYATSSGSNSFDLTANVIELVNVEQATNPVDTVGGSANNNSCANHTPSDAIAVSSGGEFVYTLASVYGSPAPGSAPTGQTVVENVGIGSLGTLAGYFLAPAVGSRTATWTVTNCSASVHALAAFKPAMTP